MLMLIIVIEVSDQRSEKSLPHFLPGLIRCVFFVAQTVARMFQLQLALRFFVQFLRHQIAHRPFRDGRSAIHRVESAGDIARFVLRQKRVDVCYLFRRDEAAERIMQRDVGKQRRVVC